MINYKLNKTSRGFDYCKFKDKDGKECSLQLSSFAGVIDGDGDDNDPRIWFGCDEGDIIAINDSNPGITANIEIPKIKGFTSRIYARMHLSQTQVKELLPILQHFAETGELSFESENDLILYEKCDLIEKEEYTDCRNCYRYDICRAAKVKELIDE